MLVDTMSQAEITREIFLDWELLIEKTLPRIAQEYDRIRRRLKVKKNSDFPKAYDIRTRRKNCWVFILRKGRDIERYGGLKDIDLSKFIHYFTPLGIRVFEIIGDKDNELAVYNAHLFSRYREIMNLGIIKPIDVVKHFFINDGYAFDNIGENGGNIFTVRQSGITLGRYSPENNWLINNTFISNGMLFDGQIDNIGQLIESIKNEIEGLKLFGKENDVRCRSLIAVLNSLSPETF